MTDLVRAGLLVMLPPAWATGVLSVPLLTVRGDDVLPLDSWEPARVYRLRMIMTESARTAVGPGG